jgi:hypothetical protein
MFFWCPIALVRHHRLETRSVSNITVALLLAWELAYCVYDTLRQFMVDRIRQDYCFQSPSCSIGCETAWGGRCQAHNVYRPIFGAT